MSEEIVRPPFSEAEEKVDSAHQEAVAELRAKVQKAKAEALKKVSG